MLLRRRGRRGGPYAEPRNLSPARSDERPTRGRSCSIAFRSAEGRRETGGPGARRIARNESQSGSCRNCDRSSSRPHARAAPRNSAIRYRFRTSCPTKTTAEHSRRSGMSRRVFRDRADSCLAARCRARAVPEIAAASTSDATHLQILSMPFLPCEQSTQSGVRNESVVLRHESHWPMPWSDWRRTLAAGQGEVGGTSGCTHASRSARARPTRSAVVIFTMACRSLDR